MPIIDITETRTARRLLQARQQAEEEQRLALGLEQQPQLQSQQLPPPLSQRSSASAAGQPNNRANSATSPSGPADSSRPPAAAASSAVHQVAEAVPLPEAYLKEKRALERRARRRQSHGSDSPSSPSSVDGADGTSPFGEPMGYLPNTHNEPTGEAAPADAEEDEDDDDDVNSAIQTGRSSPDATSASGSPLVMLGGPAGLSRRTTGLSAVADTTGSASFDGRSARHTPLGRERAVHIDVAGCTQALNDETAEAAPMPYGSVSAGGADASTCHASSARGQQLAIPPGRSCSSLCVMHDSCVNSTYGSAAVSPVDHSLAPAPAQEAAMGGAAAARRRSSMAGSDTPLGTPMHSVRTPQRRGSELREASRFSSAAPGTELPSVLTARSGTLADGEDSAARAEWGSTVSEYSLGIPIASTHSRSLLRQRQQQQQQMLQSSSSLPAAASRQSVDPADDSVHHTPLSLDELTRLASSGPANGTVLTDANLRAQQRRLVQQRRQRRLAELDRELGVGAPRGVGLYTRGNSCIPGQAPPAGGGKHPRRCACGGYRHMGRGYLEPYCLQRKTNCAMQ